MGTESTYFKDLIERLKNLNRREYAFFALLGLQAVVIIAVSLFTSFSLLEAAGHFSSTVRTILFFIFLLIVFGFTSVLFIYPLIKYFNLGREINFYEKAALVGKHYPAVKDDLLNAMELVSFEKNRLLYSAPLIDEAFKNVYSRTQDINFNSIVSFKKVKEVFVYLSAIAVVCILLIVLIPGVSGASQRLLQFNKDFIPPQKFSFEVIPGNAEAAKGDDIHIRIKVNGIVPKEVFLGVRDEEQTDFAEKKLTRDSLGNYNYHVSSVRSSFRYYAFAEEITSDEYNITVIERPVIKTFDVTVTPPSYSGIPQQKQKDNGNISALKGSIVDIKLLSTKEISEAEIVFDDTLKSQLKINSNTAAGTFRVKDNSSYKFILKDEAKNSSLNPITYEIQVLPDAYPSIEMISPAENTSLSNDNRLPLSSKISDDYGFSKLVINYRLSSSKYEPEWENFKILEIPLTKNQREIDVSYIWNLSSLNLAVDDVVTYNLEVFDNDNISGPKSSKTSDFTIRVPSLDEILAKADETQGEVQEDLKETLKEAEELKKSLEKIDQELKQDKKELTWDEKQKIEKALDKFEELQERMKESGDELSKMQQELQQNNLLSKETLEKYMELQKLFEELSGEEMKKAMERLQEMMEQLNRKDTQKAFEELKIDEERFKKSIERTMNLLKRLQAEQKLDELLKRTGELSEKQEELEKQTKEKDLNSEQEKNDLSKKQNDISKQLEKLQQEMEKLAQKMSEMPDMPNDEMEQAMDEMEKQNNEELSEEAMKDIMEKMKSQAMQKQQKISGNMKKMNELMKDMQSSMMQMNQMQTFTDMMRLLDNLLSLSKQQEELRKESEMLDPNSSQFNKNMQEQDNIQRNLDKLLSQIGELSQKTFAISPEMGKALGDAKREMMKSLQAMQNRNKGETFNSQGEAMGSLNEAASMMKSSMESMMQGGGQGGMMSMMQQMGQLSQQQMNLNNLTQMLQQGQSGKLSPQQQSQLQRLSQQQEMIRKSIQQLNQEARESGKSKSLPGSLENIAKEMQEIITNMNTQKLDDNIVQKQEKILSRMLDIQRSINERDFEKQRESNTGENITYESPSDFNPDSEEGRDRLRDELNKAVREGYSRDYEILIRKYFEMLQEKRN